MGLKSCVIIWFEQTCRYINYAACLQDKGRFYTQRLRDREDKVTK